MTMADPLVKDSNVSPIFLIPVPILTVIAVGLVGLRIWMGATRKRKIYFDDYLVVAATVWSFSLSGLND